MIKWDDIYQQADNEFSNDLKYWPQLISFLKKHQSKKILDLGCGDGTHTLKLAQEGFNVFGLDISTRAIKQAKKLFAKSKLNGQFTIASMHKPFPYQDNSFDAVISLRTINHGTRQQIEETVQEIQRILKPGGYLFLTTIKILGRKKILGPTKLNSLPVEIIAPYTYQPKEGKEVGITHFMFNKQLLREIFNEFDLQKIWLETGKKSWEKYYCLLAQLIAS